MRKERRSDFTIAAKSAEKLVIEFNTTKIERNVLIVVFVLLGMGVLIGTMFTISMISYLTIAVVLGLVFWVGFFWGIIWLVYVIAKYIPHPKALVINRVDGTLTMISCYAFRKETKTQWVSTREIEKIYIHEMSGENGNSCRLVALMQDGRRVNLYTNPHFETINQLDTFIKNFIAVLP
jgi:hypothetical protein